MRVTLGRVLNAHGYGWWGPPLPMGILCSLQFSLLSRVQDGSQSKSMIDMYDLAEIEGIVNSLYRDWGIKKKAKNKECKQLYFSRLATIFLSLHTLWFAVVYCFFLGSSVRG